MIKALLFDNYGVLMSPIYDSLRLLLPQDLYAEVIKASKLSDSGQISADERYKRVVEILNAAGLDGIREITLAINRAQRNQPLFDFILKARLQYKTALLSNASANIWELYNRSELDKYFDQVILSYQVGVIKPDERIYQIAIKRLNVQPGECVFTDDKSENVAAAVRCGMKGIIYTDFTDYVAQLREYINA